MLNIAGPEAAGRETPEQQKQEAAAMRAAASEAWGKGVAACEALGMPPGCPDPLAWAADRVEAAQAAEELMHKAAHLAEEAEGWEAWAA